MDQVHFLKHKGEITRQIVVPFIHGPQIKSVRLVAISCKLCESMWYFTSDEDFRLIFRSVPLKLGTVKSNNVVILPLLLSFLDVQIGFQYDFNIY